MNIEGMSREIFWKVILEEFKNRRGVEDIQVSPSDRHCLEFRAGEAMQIAFDIEEVPMCVERMEFILNVAKQPGAAVKIAMSDKATQEDIDALFEMGFTKNETTYDMGYAPQSVSKLVNIKALFQKNRVEDEKLCVWRKNAAILFLDYYMSILGSDNFKKFLTGDYQNIGKIRLEKAYKDAIHNLMPK